MSALKYRLKEVAADFGVAPKQIAQIMEEFFEKPKSNTQVLTEEELNVIFDYMINSHAHIVAKRIQGILNSRGASLKIDGLIGEKSLEAINNSNKKWLMDEILKNRQQHHKKDVDKNPKQIIFYAGWMNRLNKIAETIGSSLRFSPKYQ